MSWLTRSTLLHRYTDLMNGYEKHSRDYGGGEIGWIEKAVLVQVCVVLCVGVVAIAAML